jgi:hypothetical protein
VSQVHLLTMNVPCLQELPLRSPLIRATKASGIRWGKPLGVAAQPPLSKNFWRRWSAITLLLRREQNPLLLLWKRQRKGQ